MNPYQIKKRLKWNLWKLRNRVPLYGNETLKVAFEFGLILSETAKLRNVELTRETSLKAEEVFINELKEKGLQKTATNFIPLILAILEIKE